MSHLLSLKTKQITSKATYNHFAKMVEKVFDFHQNSIGDNMVAIEVAHKTTNNMD